MPDHFALLGEPRRPWIDPEQLKNKFLGLSSTVHPDRVHGGSEEEMRFANQHFAEVNAAYNCLRDPKDRLRHLLELELGTPPKYVERVPEGAMDLCFQVGQACRDADRFLETKAGPKSPMLQVQWVEQSLDWMEKLAELRGRVRTHRDQVLEEVRAMNVPWESAPEAGAVGRVSALPLERLEQLYRVLGYYSRWIEQIQARHVRLSF